MKKMMKILIFVCCLIVFSCGYASADYDIVLTGVIKYEIPVSYSNKSILVADDGFVVYDSRVLLDNCIMDVDGLAEFNSDITLIDSVINVKGDLKIQQPGTTITETGASSIIAIGDSIKTGRISLEGNLKYPIIVDSDYAANDAAFIIIGENSSSESTLKCIDFHSGWCNIWV